MEKWQCNIILIFIIWLIGALTLAGYTVYASAKPNTNSTVNNCTVESQPVNNEPVNPIVKNVTERIAEEKNITGKEETPDDSYSEEDNSLSPAEQIEQREREIKEKEVMKESKNPKKAKEEDYQEEPTESLSEPLENVDASESITNVNKLNSVPVTKSPERTDFVIHQIDGDKLTFDASEYLEMKVGKNGIVNFGKELEGAEIIVIPK